MIQLKTDISSILELMQKNKIRNIELGKEGIAINFVTPKDFQNYLNSFKPEEKAYQG